ncbi:DinB family protein [Blastococcus sp. PRF04-17]|uniref:DinB family protein n=1 Tax=Blastococcus sp. PRF04-17 TaxID=2933797 RepID=UPI001FF17270|nr:DinB family protein [Blastococcus sp. PRF04-17]UOY00876.1 DinB family protein [Blastococcus sp. PRF04-17]
MPAEFTRTDDLRGASFRDAELTGATFRDCLLTGVRIIGCEISGVRASGYASEVTALFVEDVDVSGFVTGELDRRYPERVLVREARTAAELRAAWDTLERLWSETVARAERLPEPMRFERVDDEWSFVETLRHLVFATDVWLGRMVLGEAMPYHRIGLPPTGTPADVAAGIGVDVTARPSYTEVLGVHADRQARVRQVLAGLGDAELPEMRTAEPAPPWGEETRSVRNCLGVLLDEVVEHRRFAVRDLAVLEAR